MMPSCVSIAAILLFLADYSVPAHDNSFEKAFHKLLTSDRKNASVDYNGSMRQVLFFC